MAMTYTSLVADKTTVGSIARWTNYSKLDPVTVVDEAQALLYSFLRAREMRTHRVFAMAANTAQVALPDRFLDPVGRMYCPSFNLTIRHKDSNFILANRNYTETTGTLGTDPLTTTSGVTTVSVSKTGHSFTQTSMFTLSGATAVGGITPNGTYEITSITDADNFVFDTLTLTASSSATGGGAACAYTIDNLTVGTPYWYGIWDEKIWFDTAFSLATQCQLQYYQSLPLLSSTNTTNFLTNRYPQLLRTACMASAADFMKDDTEYQKLTQRLAGMVQQINVENDMAYRGVEIETETP